MSDTKPTHLPAEGEGTPALPGETDLRPAAPASQEDQGDAPIVGDAELVPPGTSPGTGQ